jgi:hypothetical protein
VKVGDLVKNADRLVGNRNRKRLGVIVEVDPDKADQPGCFGSCFIHWMGDADWTFAYEEDIEVINASR